MREIYLVNTGWRDRGCIITKVVVRKETMKRLYLEEKGVHIVGESAYIPEFVPKERSHYNWCDTIEEAKKHIFNQLEARLRVKRQDFVEAEAALLKAHQDLEGV